MKEGLKCFGNTKFKVPFSVSSGLGFFDGMINQERI